MHPYLLMLSSSFCSCSVVFSIQTRWRGTGSSITGWTNNLLEYPWSCADWFSWGPQGLTGWKECWTQSHSKTLSRWKVWHHLVDHMMCVTNIFTQLLHKFVLFCWWQVYTRWREIKICLHLWSIPTTIDQEISNIQESFLWWNAGDAYTREDNWISLLSWL